MTLTDPLRPQMAGRPKLLNYPMAVPLLMCMPSSPDTSLVLAMLPREVGMFSWHEADCENLSIGSLLVAYHTNPEWVLQEIFHWKPPTPAEIKPATNSLPSLEELGL